LGALVSKPFLRIVPILPVLSRLGVGVPSGIVRAPTRIISSEWWTCRDVTSAYLEPLLPPLPEKHKHLTSLEFSKVMLEEALVAVSPGIGFGPMGEGYVRFALIENPQRTRQATAGIKKMLSA
jgi:hypothetical protein